MADYAGLKEGGGLSVKIGGVEHVNDVHGLWTETTSNGDGGAGFWVEPANPFVQIADEFRPGATVDVTHTYTPVSTPVTTQLYKGFIISDAKRGYAGETKRVDVECGGVLDVAQWRQDASFIYTDSGTENWFENPKNGKWATIDISDCLEIRAEEGVKVPRGPRDSEPRAAVIGYVAYEGATYMLKVNGGPVGGVRRIRGTVSGNLKQGMQAKLGWADEYTVNRDPRTPPDGAYSTIHTWTTGNTYGNRDGGEVFDYSVDGTNGAGYIALCFWSTNDGVTEMTADRFIRLEHVEVYYEDINEKRVSDAMIAVANVLGYHTTSTTANIGSVIHTLRADPPTDPISAMNLFAQQAYVLVQWGWWGYYSSGSKYRFYCRPLETSPTAIRALDNCYSINAGQSGVTWDVRQHPEDGANWKAVRLIFGRRGASGYPAGFPDTVHYPSTGGWGTGKAFIGASSRILSVDFSGHNYTREVARSMAKRLFNSLGSGQSSGTCELRVPLVHRVNSGTTWVPTPYLKGGDWVECEQSSCGPLLITRHHIDYDTETVTLEVGIEEESLIEQLEAVGAVRRIKRAPRRKRGWRNG